mmetsp:Transcript_78666/g.91976  ORF Transcript_78666/g.91976 Transcript_78666/m.91976 type:complete len:230 (+) Transcript_78666:30-719(+)
MPSGPKTNKFMNRHAAEAMERDEVRKATQKAANERAKEDALWAETDSRALKKAEKDREAQEKAMELERRRAESKAQLEEEDRANDKSKLPPKVSKKMMQREVAKLVASYDAEVSKVRGAASEKPEVHAVHTKSENVVGVEGHAAVPDARHIGKRARVLYRQFCDEHSESVKEAHSGLRRSQINDILWEMWQKSPQNPFVLRKEARDAERLAEERRWMEGDDSDDEGEQQ